MEVPMDLQSLYDQAVAAHRQGKLAEAEHFYLQILTTEPGSALVRYPLGLLRAQQGRPQEALDLIGSALLANPNSSEMLLNYGNVLLSLGRFVEALAIFTRALDFSPRNVQLLANHAMTLMRLQRFEEALASFDRALMIEPGNASLLQGRGDALLDLRRHEAALESYDRALAMRPRDAVAHNNRGNALKKLGRLEEALTAFDKAVAVQPDYVIAHNNRGNTLKMLGRLAEAVAALDRALTLKPDFGAAYYNRGKALCESQRIAEGFSDFMKSAQLAQGVAAWSVEGRTPRAHKAKHDREQQDYLVSIGSKAKVGGLAIEGGGRLKGPAINRANLADAAQQWHARQPQIMVIDNLLTDEALAELRRFCWGSTVWRSDYESGYLGAFPEHGFASPLLAQIADEFRTTYADICGSHALKYAWAFKYDSTVDGIAIHADSAAVNVNFWITPDEANLDPERGGLVVWDVAAPLHWEFSKYNGDIAATRDFLKRSNAKPVTIPYRSNRAVVFDSDLFHETDTVRFKEGYLNRRINVTLLYGERDPG
jgi:tetratricopeptide (TPR) repeat protein